MCVHLTYSPIHSHQAAALRETHQLQAGLRDGDTSCVACVEVEVDQLFFPVVFTTNNCFMLECLLP